MSLINLFDIPKIAKKALFVLVAVALGAFFLFGIDVPKTSAVDKHWAYEFIEGFYKAHYTAGCAENPAKYCPDDPITRSQMAVFIIRGMNLQPDTASPQIYSDTPSSHFAYGYVQKLGSLSAFQNVASCNSNLQTFCPDQPLTRAEAAVMIIDALGESPPPATSQTFQDVPVSHPAAAHIQRLYEKGITAGCGLSPLRYCPSESFTRAQIAVMFSKAFSIPTYDNPIATFVDVPRGDAVPPNIDSVPPSIPENLHITSATRAGISIAWYVPFDNVGVFYYRLYRDGTILAVPIPPFYTDTTAEVGKVYTYTVSALDPSGNESGQSLPVTARIKDSGDIPPPVVAKGTLVGRVMVSGTSSYIVDRSVSGCANARPEDGFTVNFSGPTSGSMPIIKCDPDPYYEVNLLQGTYTVSLTIPPGWKQDTSNIQTVQIDGLKVSHIWFSAAEIPGYVDPAKDLKDKIFNQYGITIYDNNKLDEKQLSVIYQVLQNVSTDLYNLRVITVNDFLNGEVPQPSEQARINILGMPVGYLCEDGIPDSVSECVDIFSIVFIHELNHRVSYKYNYEGGLVGLDRREKILIDQAGTNHLQYLRNMLPDGYFVSYPQEFFASIANAYFQNSKGALDYATEQFNLGNQEPLNQFLFFVEVYSGRVDSVKTYKLDYSGELTVADTGITRDEYGIIASLDFEGLIYRFESDKRANVIAVHAPTSALPKPDSSPPGTILGRVAVSGSGQFIRDPSGQACSHEQVVNGFFVNYSLGADAGTAKVNFCNPDPYYAASLSPGMYTVSLTVPAGWETVGQNQRQVTIQSHEYNDQWWEVRKVTAVAQVADMSPSSVLIHASGTPAIGQYPVMELRTAGGTALSKWTVNGTVQDYTYVGSLPKAENLRVYFTNDYYDGKEDRNLIVDYLTYNGHTYQSEAADVYESGYWSPATGTASGFFGSQVLYGQNSYFEYPTTSQTVQ